MTEVNVVSSPTGVKLGVGPYAYSDLTIVPDWYLAHLLAGVADPKWDALTPEQQEAVKAESKRRHPDDQPVGSPVAGAVVASASPLQPASAGSVASSTPHTRESDETILSGTVAEVSEFVSKVTNTTELDALKTVEEAGKNRAGVLDAIEKRRGVLAANAASAAEAGSKE